MFQRQRSGSVVCPSCGKLVSVKERQCPYCSRPFPGMFGFTGILRGLGQDMGFVPLVTWGCGLLYLVTLLVDPSQIFAGGLFGMLSPSTPSLFLFGASGAIPVFGEHRWWTLLSAAWLHGSLLHIVFNLMWVRDLGHLTTEAYGAGRTMIVYVVSGVTGFLLSTSVAAFLPFLPPFLAGAQITVGASASLFGMMGALVYYGRRAGASQLSAQVKKWVIVLVIFGFLWPRVDNWAHLGGFLGGYLAGRMMDPLQPERTDHLIGGFVCLLLSLGAVVVSVVHGIPILRQLGLLQ